MADITALLQRMRDGDRDAADLLLRTVYDQLKAMAASHGPALRGRFGATPTLGPTALVHEAWVKLAGGSHGNYEDRRHFFAVAASAMRSVLVDHSRARAALKRGGDRVAAASTSSGASVVDDAAVVCGIHDALEQLERVDPELVRIVELRFFLGLGVQETAATLGTSESTVKRQSRLARMFLRRSLDPIETDPDRDDTETRT
ncbi:MAG: RNA polymerase subunit sigma-70 [Planctomycetes bacterium]|nr:RNA polymerase subunit sigma-70 [Planctomycetota bacterium]MCC7171660.1 RNA polymerase subunit sigma-70 [Planctomycetota bacterium]